MYVVTSKYICREDKENEPGPTKMVISINSAASSKRGCGRACFARVSEMPLKGYILLTHSFRICCLTHLMKTLSVLAPGAVDP